MRSKSALASAALLFIFIQSASAQSWKSFNILSGNPNATGNEIRFLNGTTGCLGSTITTTNGVPSGNNNLPYGAAFDPTEGKLYYSKPGTIAGTSVFNVYNNTGASPTNTFITTITGGEFFRMGVGQDGNVYGTVTALVTQLSASAPRIDIQTVKLTRYNPATNTLTILGNIQCPPAYASTMPAPYNDGNYWSSSDATTTPFYAAQLGHSGYGDLVISPNNTMYMTIGKKLITIPNYSSISGTALVPSVEVGNILPAGVGYNFSTQGSGTYGLSWDYANGNLLAISSRSSDGSDGSYNVNPATGALVGSFRVNCLATPTSANFADLTEVISSIGLAKQLTSVQWLGYNNRYRMVYRIRIENIGTSTLKNVQVVENLQTAFPSLTISNISAAFVSNPSSLVLNAAYNGTSVTNLLSGTKTLYAALYKGANLNGGPGNITAGSNFALVDITMDVAGVTTNGSTTYNNTAAGTGTAFDGTTVTDNSDNGTAVETGIINYKADDAGEGDATPVKFGSTVSGTVWIDANNSANNTFSNIFTAGESGTNASGLNAILVDPVTNLVIASVPVAANGTYSFTNVPSFANLQVRLSTTAGTAGSAPPAAGLPAGWTATSPLSTNTTGDINTGTYNAADAARFGAIDDINNDFGIQQPPTSPSQTYTVTAPATNSFRTLNGTGAVSNPGVLTGTDPEDGILGSGKTFNITVGAGMNGNKLFYNGVEITSSVTIPNYNPALLTVQYTGAGSTSLSFVYQSFDAAGAASNLATYSINWLSPLPLRLFTATAVLNGTTAAVSWKTDNETNTSYFYAERSTDNKNFIAFATVAAAGNSTVIKNYSTTDDISALAASTIYYRVKLVDADGRITYSNTVVLRITGIDGVKVWPAPFTSVINISLYSNILTEAQVILSDITGKKITAETHTLAKGNNQLNISSLAQLPQGVYMLQVVSKTGAVNFVQKLVKE
jgi:hypothetical protein